MTTLSPAIQQEIAQIHHQLNIYQHQGKRMFVSSSFQTHSLPLLHILSKTGLNIPVVFINTGFHFAQTLHFRDEVAKLLALEIIDLHSDIPKVQQRDEKGNFYFTSDTDYCCHINKVKPVDDLLTRYDVWINGIRADQNANRRNMQAETKTPGGKLRYHPMLNWTSKMIFEYAKHFQLPKHPLEASGYLSVGCEPCTQKFALTDERAGRWAGQQKTECGLHTALVAK